MCFCFWIGDKVRTGARKDCAGGILSGPCPLAYQTPQTLHFLAELVMEALCRTQWLAKVAFFFGVSELLESSRDTSVYDDRLLPTLMVRRVI